MKYSKYNILTKNGDEYIFYNSITKASVSVNEEFKTKYIDNNNIAGLKKEDYDFLVENNFIVEDNKDETIQVGVIKNPGQYEYLFFYDDIKFWFNSYDNLIDTTK